MSPDGPLVALLRTTSSPEQAWALAASHPERALVRRSFMPFLHELLAVDGAHSRRFVSLADLNAWGLDASTAFAQGREALLSSEGLSLRPDGLWELVSPDGCAASRLLLPGWLAAFSERLGGAPLCAVPHARSVLIGTESQAELLLMLAEQSWSTEGEPISPALYTVNTEGVVVPWVSRSDSALAVRSSNAYKKLAHREYRRQSESLSESYPVLFARLGLLNEEQSGRLIQVTAWTQGTEPLLPLADVIVLHPTEGESLWVSFSDFVTLSAGSLSLWEGVEPPRYRATRWPDSPLWENLGRCALATDLGQ